MRLYFSTELAPCPYLEDRLERRLVTALGGPDANRRHDHLMRAGFRRSQRYAYRPTCPGCQACVPVRIPVADFCMTRSWRRILRHNADLVAAERPAVATEEQFLLFRCYLAGRHDESGMTDMTWDDYQAMAGDSTVDSMLVEWRRSDGRLMAVSLTDRTASGLSGVYKFFEPEEPRRSLGSLIILWHVRRAAELGLPHVYLGYWIAESPKMAYKIRFQPLERLTDRGWQRISPDLTERPTGQVASTGSKEASPLGGRPRRHRDGKLSGR
jgi:arginyl-tRNA--protein-N-Asp/Glu arginylyltransferase